MNTLLTSLLSTLSAQKKIQATYNVLKHSCILGFKILVWCASVLEEGRKCDNYHTQAVIQCDSVWRFRPDLTTSVSQNFAKKFPDLTMTFRPNARGPFQGSLCLLLSARYWCVYQSLSQNLKQA